MIVYAEGVTHESVTSEEFNTFGVTELDWVWPIPSVRRYRGDAGLWS